jgi:hypothetical protein
MLFKQDAEVISMLAIARSPNATDEGDTISEVCFTRVLGFSRYGVDADEVYGSM